MLVDTHCHLGDPAFDADRAEVVARARSAGIDHVIVVADTIEATRQAGELARRFGCSATAGVHPHSASTWSDAAAVSVREALDAPETVAVGETGLDYHYDLSPRPAQRAAFEAQLALGEATGMPVVVHARDADDDMVAMLRAWNGRATIVLHSFSSGSAVFTAGLETGAYISFSGMVTFRNWTGRDYVTSCPDDRLLVETDAPYLAPVPHRGRRNEPAYVAQVAERIAEWRGTAAADIATLTTANAARCFGPRVAQPMMSEGA